jgi:hypothetical protein
MPVISGDIAVEEIVVSSLMLLFQRYWMLDGYEGKCNTSKSQTIQMP